MSLASISLTSVGWLGRRITEPNEPETVSGKAPLLFRLAVESKTTAEVVHGEARCLHRCAIAGCNGDIRGHDVRRGFCLTEHRTAVMPAFAR
ncbi:hypothetical protein E2C01_034596 [Portunus trituberculatus]|uniref:Uncharacterized protein n=1 Tax=Portunus trituberculatus TaxID=210409 RepID=A0A5B7F6R0_PORTR|nr:hypothetical protein [Portunus trituberculatus]